MMSSPVGPTPAVHAVACQESWDDYGGNRDVPAHSPSLALFHANSYGRSRRLSVQQILPTRVSGGSRETAPEAPAKF